MPEFNFYGRNEAGVELRGKRQALSPEALAAQLSEERILPITIEPVIEQRSLLQRIQRRFQQKTSLQELRIFARQMYSLSKAGIPIVTAVSRLAQTSRNSYFATVLHDVAENLNAGKTLSQSMEKYTAVFSTLFVNMIRVGESSARLDAAFQQIAFYLAIEENTIKRIKSTVRYPLIVFLVLIASLFVVNFLVIPAFASMFSIMRVELPLPTQILVASSNFMLDYWPFALLTTVSGLIALRVYLSTDPGKYTWHRLQLRLPFVGWLIKRILLVRFCRTQAMIMRSGISILDGIKLVAATLDNVYMQKKIMAMHEHIAHGESLSSSAANANLFSPLILQMLILGEETGKIEDMLDEVADFYEREVDYDLDRLSDLIEPILLLFISAMVLLLAMGIFLPMWNMVGFV